MPIPTIIGADRTGDFTYRLAATDTMFVLAGVKLQSSASFVFSTASRTSTNWKLDISGEVYGVNTVQMGSADTLTVNAGAILAGSDASIRVAGDGNIVSNAGLIDGRISAAWFTGGGNILSNSGEIRTWNPAPNSNAVFFSGDAAAPRGERNNLWNSGWIHSPGTAVLANTKEDIYIDNSGTLTAGEGKFAIEVLNSATIENAGVVSGGVKISQGQMKLSNRAAGHITGPVTAGSLATADILNEGEIVGAVGTGNAADQLINSGVIRGAIDLGRGDNVLKNTGQIFGSVAAGGGVDRITNSGVIHGGVSLGDGSENSFDNTGGYVDGVISGGAGWDFLLGGARDDRMDGAAGNDTLMGGFGDDVLSGGYGQDTLYGNQDNDVLYGNQDDDWIYGGQGADKLYGGQGKDHLWGNLGDDLLMGNLGDDTLNGGAGSNTLDGGEGVDVVSYLDAASGVTVNLMLQGQAQATGVSTDVLLGVENLQGSNFADALTGDAGANIFDGGLGDDVMTGGYGADMLSGGSDNDILYGNQDADQLFGGWGADTLYGGQGDDILDGGAGDDVLAGNLGNDTFVFFGQGFGHDKVTDFRAGGGADVIRFGPGVFASFADLQAHAVQTSAGVLLSDTAGDSVLIVGAVTGALTADMFVIG